MFLLILSSSDVSYGLHNDSVNRMVSYTCNIILHTMLPVKTFKNQFVCNIIH